MFDLSLNLWEDLMPGFSKTWVYLISQIEESWRVRMSWALGADRLAKIGDFILIGYCTGFAHGVTALEKNLLLFKMSLTSFYLVSGRPLLLLGSFCLLLFMPV